MVFKMMKAGAGSVGKQGNTTATTKKQKKQDVYYSIEGRELDPVLDVVHLKIKKPFIMLACGSDSRLWPKKKSVFEKRCLQAAEKLVQTTPILQTKIAVKQPHQQEANESKNDNTNSETDQETTTDNSESKIPATTTAPTYIYTKHESQANMPFVTVHFGEYSNDDVTAMIYDLERQELEFYDHGGSDTANRCPLRLHVVRGKHRAVFLQVWPHSFMDGIGAGTCFVKAIMYWIVPRCLWFAVDRLNTYDVPTFKQMALKQDFDAIMARRHEFTAPTAKADPNNFCFVNFDTKAATALDQLIGGEFKFQPISMQLVNAARHQFRESGVSVSCAMSALSIRTFALILQKFGLNPDCRPLVATTPIDARNLGKWGDRRRDKKTLFPVVANYAFSLCTQIPYQEALEEDGLVKVATRIKQGIKRLQTELEYRAQHVFFPGFPTCGLVVGTTTVMVPSMIVGERTGVKDPTVYSRGFFGSPHVWFTIVTMDGLCSNAHFFVGLPIPGLDRATIFDCVLDAVAKTPFEAFFQLLGDGHSTPTPL